MCRKQTAAGKSTCYLTIDSEKKHMLYANYWSVAAFGSSLNITSRDSTIGAMPLAPEGTLEPGTVHICSGVKQASSVRAEHLNNRQAEPHAHAIVLDQYFGRVAYVPDLGSDCIRQYLYDSDTGQLKAAGSVPAGRVHTCLLVVIDFHIGGCGSWTSLYGVPCVFTGFVCRQ